MHSQFNELMLVWVEKAFAATMPVWSQCVSDGFEAETTTLETETEIEADLETTTLETETEIEADLETTTFETKTKIEADLETTTFEIETETEADLETTTLEIETEIEVDLETTTLEIETETEAVLETLTSLLFVDVVLVIRHDRVDIYCNPLNYVHLLPLIAHWRRLRIHCLPDTQVYTHSSLTVSVCRHNMVRSTVSLSCNLMYCKLWVYIAHYVKNVLNVLMVKLSDAASEKMRLQPTVEDRQ